MNRDFALKLVQKTKEDYNKISAHFNQTRGYSWTEFELIKDYFHKNDKVLDIGCGNGRLLDYLLNNEPSINYFGVDASEKLIEHAKEKYPKSNFQVGDFLNLPFENNSFDIVVSIAAFHHIPSEELRLEALGEIRRALKNGGRFILTVWNLWEQEKYQPFIKQEDEENFDKGDSLIPWKFSDGKIGTLATERYYHAFTLEEAESLFNKSGFKILKSEKTKFNFLFVLEN